jgi:hypothetical protein
VARVRVPSWLALLVANVVNDLVLALPRHVVAGEDDFDVSPYKVVLYLLADQVPRSRRGGGGRGGGGAKGEGEGKTKEGNGQQRKRTNVRERGRMKRMLYVWSGKAREERQYYNRIFRRVTMRVTMRVDMRVDMRVTLTVSMRAVTK